MGSAPWKQLLLNSLQSNSNLKHSPYFQLATIGSNGRPANRTVVFRGFQENSDRIQINTDSRTHKIGDLKGCPFAEICWYFTDSWEQFRINGQVDVIDGSNPDPLKLQQREKAWFASSPRSRQQYLGPYPGLPSLNDQSSVEPSLDHSAGPVDAFCLLVLDPDQVQPESDPLNSLNIDSNRDIPPEVYDKLADSTWIMPENRSIVDHGETNARSDAVEEQGKEILKEDAKALVDDFAKEGLD